LCLPSVYTTAHMKSPRPSPPYLHAASNQRLEEGMAWKWGEGVQVRVYD